MEYILLILIFLVGAVLGWRLREKAAVRNLSKIIDSAEEQQEDLLRIPVNIQRVDGELMAYSIKDNSFMAQGWDWDELEQRLISRFPGKKFKATRENLIEMGFKL
jgi:hypothetical protein